MKNLTEEDIKLLKDQANKLTSVEDCPEDWNPYDLSGGNYDDCYYIGYNDAKIEHARWVLEFLEMPY